MKIKLKRLKQKLLPNMTNFLCRVHHQDMLYEEFTRRMTWRINVLESCDNYDEMFPSKSDVDVERIIFPSRRSLPKVFSTTFPHRFSGSVVFHIIRQGKHKWRIVKKKHKTWEPRMIKSKISHGMLRYSDSISPHLEKEYSLRTRNILLEALKDYDMCKSKTSPLSDNEVILENQFRFEFLPASQVGDYLEREEE